MTMINSYSTRQLRDEEFDEDSDFYFEYNHHAWWEWDVSEKLDITAEKELLMGWDTPEHDRAWDKRRNRGHFEINIHVRPNRYIVGDLIYDNSENLYIPFKYIDYPPHNQPDMICYSDDDETRLRVLPFFQAHFISVVQARDVPGMVEYQTIFKTDDNARRNSFVIARDKFPKIFDAVQTFDISGWNPVDDGKTSKADELSRLIKLFTDTADFWDSVEKFNARKTKRGAA